MNRVTSDLGAYVLPGRAADPRPGLHQAKIGEQLGLGSIWVSERWETKEISATLGALSQTTTRVKLVAGVTHFGTRHPIVLAGMASTVQALSDNRLTLGFGRSVTALWKQLGVAVPSGAAMSDYVAIFRALWRGETVTYDGPAGRYPNLRLAAVPAVAPPVILAAIGPQTLKLAGAHFDGVVLHPFLTVDGVARSAAIVRNAAKKAGRDPESVRVYAEVVVAPDCTDEEIAGAVHARAATYFSLRELGGQIIAANRWDTAPMDRLLEDPRFANLEIQASTGEEFRARTLEAASLLPRQWMTTGAAIGTANDVATQLREFRAAGADEIVLHGTTTDRLGPLLELWAAS